MNDNEYWPESLTEEFRQMIRDASFKMWKQFFDEITFTPDQKRRRDRAQLGKRVRHIAIDLELSGQFADAAILMEAAENLIQENK